MKVTIKRKSGESIIFNQAYEVFGRGLDVVDGKVIDEFFVVLYPDEIDNHVEAEMAYRTETIENVVITF